jgi:hypothetical protein
MPMTTNRAAPALTPRMPGSASGLRARPCITAPPTPSAAPASRPTAVRGIRSDLMIRWSLFVGSWWKRASRTVPNGIDLAPMAMLARHTSASAPTATASPAARPTRRVVDADGAGFGPVASRTSSVIPLGRGCGRRP